MRAVLALCLVALVGAQIASAGFVYLQPYTADFVNHPENFFCKGNASSTITTNFTGGACNNGYQNTTSNSFHCDGGNAVIYISYLNGDCQQANVLSMARIPTVCGAYSVSAKWVCSGTDPLPFGWTYPPSGWAQSSTQYNNTWDGTASGPSPLVGACGTLPASANAVTITGATAGGCKNANGTTNQNPKRSSQSFQGGFSAQYNSYDCNSANLISLTQYFDQGCKNGVTSSGITGGPSAPDAPVNYATNSIKASRTYYSKTGDSNYCGNKISTTYYASTCFDSLKVECQNGTQYYESYYGVNTDGACQGTPTMTWRNTSSAYCMQSGATDFGYSYSCSGNSPQGGSASTASFSVVVLAIAALLALLSQ